MKKLLRLLAAVSVGAPAMGLLVLSLQNGGGAWAVLLGDAAFARALKNSLLLCAAGTAGQLALGIPAAWGLAAYRFPGRRALLFAAAVLMLLPVQTLLLPQYLLLRSCGLLGTLPALLLPLAFQPMATVILWHGFSAFPPGAAEAARLEGAGPWTVLRRIVLPGCKPHLFAAALLAWAEGWNLLEQPMAYLSDPAGYPLSVYLATNAWPDPARRAAGCLLALAPLAVLCLFAACRSFRYAAKGATDVL